MPSLRYDGVCVAHAPRGHLGFSAPLTRFVVEGLFGSHYLLSDVSARLEG